MAFNNKEEELDYYMRLQSYFFNPKKAPKNKIIFQFNFNEPEGLYSYFLTATNQECQWRRGQADQPDCVIKTDLITWQDIGGNYLSGKKAMKAGRFKLEKGFFKFLFRFNKIFSGNQHWQLPDNRYLGRYKIKKIKKVLVLSCSPRAKKGATQFLIEKMIPGMEKAGAKVKLMLPAAMKINPCQGCFTCWVANDGKCIYHDQDEMKLILDEFNEADLVIWATPIYVYHCTTVMKVIMDRLVVRADPHLTHWNNKTAHPRRKKKIPYFSLFATAGFNNSDVFHPLKETFRVYGTHNGYQLINGLFITCAMTFLSDINKNVKKDQILKQLETAGFELITRQDITSKSRKIIQQQQYPNKQYISAANFNWDLALESKVLHLQRKS